MIRPFKVAFSDIQNYYSNIKINNNDNVMREIVTNVFSQSLEVEIPKISRCVSFLNLLSSFSKNQNIFEYKKVQKLKSGL